MIIDFAPGLDEFGEADAEYVGWRFGMLAHADDRAWSSTRSFEVEGNSESGDEIWGEGCGEAEARMRNYST